MDLKKIFQDKFIISLFILFILCALTCIIYSSLMQRAVAVDGAIWFPDMLSRFSSSNDKWSELIFYGNFNARPRVFISMLNAIPANIAYFILHIKSKYILSVIFSMPFFLFSFLVLIMQFVLTLRSKRVDIFVSSLIMYTALVIPVYYHAICEFSLASSLIFLLFHYLCADIKFNFFDYFIIIFLCIMSYYSTESYIYTGPILFLASLYYAKKAKNKKIKFIRYFIGINCLISGIWYIILFYKYSWNYIDDSRVFLEFNAFYPYLVNYLFYIDIALIFGIIFCLIKKERMKKFSFIILTIITLVSLFIILKNQSYLNSPYFFRRGFILLALPILILVNIFVDLIKNKISEMRINNVLYNIIIIFLFLGCMYSLISIADTHTFRTAVNIFKQELKKNENIPVIMPEVHLADFYASKLGMRYFCCDTYIYDFINFSDKFEFNNIMSTSLKREECPHKLYFKDNMLHLAFNSMRVKTEFWDLTGAEKNIENNDELKSIYSEKNFEE